MAHRAVKASNEPVEAAHNSVWPSMRKHGHAQGAAQAQASTRNSAHMVFPRGPCTMRGPTVHGDPREPDGYFS